MKIALVGTHNSGKTTALWNVGSELKKRGYKDFTLIQEVVRACPYPMFDPAFNFQCQLWTMLHQILAEMEAQRRYKNVITDRSVFDQLVYYRAKLPNKSDYLKDPYYAELTMLRNLANKWEDYYPYDYIFWFRPLEVDNKRKQFQKCVDKLFGHELWEPFPQTSVVEVRTPKNERCKKVTEKILELFENEK